jgi:plastocyanin
MILPRRLIGALSLLAILGAACGDDNKVQEGKSSDTTASTVPAPTKVEFIAAADAICAKASDQMDPIFEALFGGGEPTPAAAQESLGKVLDFYAQQFKDLRALRLPTGEQDQITALWADGDKTVADTRTRIGSSAGAALEVLQSDEEPFAAFEEKAKAYGFKDCGAADKTETFGGVELSADEQAKATKLAVEAFEYGYKGISATLPAGPAVFSFTNIGTENHEIGMVRVKPGVTAAQAIAKVKADPDDESYVEEFLGAGYALKGEHTDLSVKLKPGLYGYACMVKAADGTAHSVKGMVSTFTVR